ncbi:MAG TPA: universal stress protein [Anaeromyxobacteraceae bacterium]|nr:universal stress protein [Anaeromyxobacteraceae bacterium]
MPELTWSKICCPVDFSEPARAAMETAVAIARRFDAQLTLFHAYQLPGYTLPEGSVVASPKMLQELADQAEHHLEEWKRMAEQMGAPRVATAKSIGEPSVEIVEFAKETGQDLLVIGTHGRTGLRHALVGSIAERVVRRAGCPVLSVHPEGHARVA